jgi:hypothetical protein
MRKIKRVQSLPGLSLSRTGFIDTARDTSRHISCHIARHIARETAQLQTAAQPDAFPPLCSGTS